MTTYTVESAEDLDEILYQLNEAGLEPAIPVIDAKDNVALAYLDEVGGDEVQPGIVIGGQSMSTVTDLDRDQKTSWLTYPVTVLYIPDPRYVRTAGPG